MSKPIEIAEPPAVCVVTSQTQGHRVGVQCMGIVRSRLDRSVELPVNIKHVPVG